MTFEMLLRINTLTYCFTCFLYSNTGKTIAHINAVIYGKYLMPSGWLNTVIPKIPMKLESATPKINPPTKPTIIATKIFNYIHFSFF